MPSRLFEHKQHAAIGRERIALHQAAFTLLWGGGDFNLEDMLPDVQGDPLGAFCGTGAAESHNQ
jgi:hypothetical protein